LVEHAEAIIDEILKGNKGLYEELVREYQKKVFYTVYRMVNSQEDALDLTQETFLQAYKQLGQFNRQAGFYTWLYRIATNKTLDFLRKQKSIVAKQERLMFECETTQGLALGSNNPEEIYLKKEGAKTVQEAINSLPDKYRITLVLHHYDQCSYRQIAEILQLPEKTVATRIYRARLLLKEKLLKGGKELGMQRSSKTSTSVSSRGNDRNSTD